MPPTAPLLPQTPLPCERRCRQLLLPPRTCGHRTSPSAGPSLLDSLQADTGTKMIHVGKNTRSRIVSKGISAGNSVNAYRGLVQVRNAAAATAAAAAAAAAPAAAVAGVAAAAAAQLLSQWWQQQRRLLLLCAA